MLQLIIILTMILFKNTLKENITKVIWNSTHKLNKKIIHTLFCTSFSISHFGSTYIFTVLCCVTRRQPAKFPGKNEIKVKCDDKNHAKIHFLSKNKNWNRKWAAPTVRIEARFKKDWTQKKLPWKTKINPKNKSERRTQKK